MTNGIDDVSLNEDHAPRDTTDHQQNVGARLRRLSRAHRVNAPVQQVIDATVHALHDDDQSIGQPLEDESAGRATRPARGSLFLRRLLIGLDAIALLASWGPFVLLYPSDDLKPRLPIGPALAVAMCATTLVALAFAASQHLYQSRVCSMKRIERSLLVRVSVASMIVGGFILWLFGDRPADASLALDGAVAFVLLAAGRSGYRAWLGAQRRRGRYCRPMIIVGTNDEALRWCQLLAEHPELGMTVQGLVGDEPPALANSAIRWLGRTADLKNIVFNEAPTSALVIVTAFNPATLNRITRQALTEGLHVELSTGLLGFAVERLRLRSLSHESLFYLEHRPLTPVAMATKRTFDVVVACFCLIVSLPILVIASLVIHLSDGGPALFRQQRVGRGGKTFTFYKLRTMTEDAEVRKQDVAGQNLRQAPLFKVADDPRVTPVGRRLRRWSIDELPQLVNVLQGHMSLVGPRPALPEEVEQFDAELLARHLVLPGITGLWQLEARDNVSFDSYQRLDLHYVENWSIFLDMSIFLSTVMSVLARTLHRERLSNS